jgi:protein-S-isoprenylcysteine O-methyltransferase Ste14
MDNKLFFSLVIVCAITHLVRLVYEILKHKEILKPDKVTFVIVFLNMALLWISWFLLCSQDAYRIELPRIIRYLGLSLVCVGGLLFFIALFTIKTLESYEGDLMTKGIYSKIRHPIYLGFILWLIGFPLSTEGLFSFCLSFLFIANVLFWKYLEEKELVQRFPNYADYKKTTIF